mgnify:CR=1 FL=1
MNYGTAESALKGAGDLTGKIVVDISNPITPDYKALVVGHTTSAAEEIQKLVPGARVVKAFNTIFAQLLPAEARGAASGVINAGGSLGQFIFAPLLQKLIQLMGAQNYLQSAMKEIVTDSAATGG